ARNPFGLNINLARIAATLKAEDKIGFGPIVVKGRRWTATSVFTVSRSDSCTFPHRLNRNKPR
ncbi:unnamed protein product, partial [Musa hybrid cultivar]